MSNNIKINIDVNDNGTTAKATKSAEGLKNTLKDAASRASQIRVPLAVDAATQGVQAQQLARITKPVSASYVASKSESQDYDKTRAAVGTGAAGRDFANQAQGLGGLVRVYATFAANLFAVSAAFSALSKAADTSNMVKGLDQLGASSGRALGSLAKQLSSVTDGAISMRDAMTATVSASAGGMTNAAILRMGVVAKQASQALGVAMPDALSRISRGITKLEPELLDEIGIMVRVDTASQNYARTLGKTAASLTDFEKRQGFANAVLEQGEKKFGAIQLDTNPYDKLLASMQNLAQSGLDLVNKVLGPLVNFLSSSPTALATVMAGIGAVLLKQAIPAIGAWRSNLKQLALEAGNTAERINTSFGEYQVAQSLKHSEEIEKRIQVEKAAAVKSLNIAKDATKISGLTKGKVFDLTTNIPKTLEEETKAYKLLDSQIKSNETRGLNLAASDSKAAKASLDRADALRALKAQMPELIRLEKELDAAQSKALDEMTKKERLLGETWSREQIAKKAKVAAAKAEVLSNVGENTQIMGIAGAWNQAKADIADKGLKGLDSGVTKVRAGLLIATSAVGTFMNAISGVMMVVGLAVAAFSLLNSWLSSNSKEAEAFSNSVTGVTDAVGNLNRTIDFIGNKDPLAVFSVETIQARANALQGLSDSLVSLVKNFDAAQKASSWWDKGIDALWDAIGRGSADKLSTNIAESISAGLKGAVNKAAKDEAISKLKAILGKDVDVTNFKQVNEELRKLGNSEVAAAGAEVNKILRDLSLNANNAVSDLTSAFGRIKEISTLIQSQNLALMPTDAVGKLGSTILSSAADITRGLQDPINAMLTLNELVNDSRTLSILSPSVAGELMGAKSQIEDLNASYGKLQQDLVNGEKELEALKSSGKATKREDTRSGIKVVDTDAATAAKTSIASIQTAMVAAEAKMKEVGSTLSAKIATDFVTVGLANLNLSLKVAMSEGAITAAKGYLSVLKDAGVGTAAAEAKLAQQELGMQRQVLEATYNQIKAQAENTSALEINNIGQRLLARSVEMSTADTARKLDNIAEKYKGLDPEYEVALKKREITEMKPKDALALKSGGKYSDELLAGMAPYMSALTGYLSGLATLGGKAEAARIQGFANIDKEKTAKAQSLNTEKIDRNAREIGDLDLAISLSAEYDRSLAIKKDVLETDNRRLKLANEILKIESDLRIIEEAKRKGFVSEVKIKEAITAAEASKITKTEAAASANKAAQAASLKNDLEGTEKIRQAKVSAAELVRSELQAITAIQLTQQAEELKYLETIGVLTAEESSKKQTSIALSQQALETERAQLDLATKYTDTFMDLENKKQQSAVSNPEASAKFAEQQASLTASYVRQAEVQSLLNAGKVTSITLAGQQDALLKSQTADMDKMVAATESLATMFGELGSNIGLAGQALLKMAKDDQTYLANKKNLEDKLFNAKNPEEEAALLKDLNKLDKKKSKDEIDNIGKVAGASKKMFSEKTAAYRIMSGVEKVVHVVKMGMMAAELVADIKGTISSVANSSTRAGASVVEAGVDGVKAVVKAIAAFPPPFNYIAGAATAALVGGLLSSIGGKSPSASGGISTTGLTSADRQETQGTGQAWVGSAKVDTGGGIFGDSSEKATSIVDSLEILRDNSIEGLSYDNKMLKAMEKLANSVTGAAKSLYSIPGLRQGTNFGTSAGSTTGGTSGILGSIFGGKTTSTTSITSAGLLLKGTFQDVIDNVSGSLMQYKDVLTQYTKSGGWFSKSKAWSTLRTETQALSSTVQESVSDIFRDASNLFSTLGQKIGTTSEYISNVLSTFDVSMPVDVMGLTGQALVDELNAVVGSKLSEAANIIFPGFEKFRDFGEDYLTTVVRVVDSSNKVKSALASIGTSIPAVGFALFNMTDSLIQAAGGLNSFIEQSNFFRDNFLTSEEKLLPLQASVSTQLESLGLSAKITKDEFKNLVLAQNLSTDSGRSMYQSLMELAPGFVSMTGLIADVASEAEGLSGKTLDLRIKLLTLEGKVSEATAISRATELKVLSELDKALQVRIWRLEDEAKRLSMEAAIYTALGDSVSALSIARTKELNLIDESLRPYQLYLYALQDEAALKGKLTTAYNKESSAIKNTINTLSSSVKTLNEYKLALTAGTSSILTPTEKYAQAKSELQQTSLLARTALTDSATEAQISERSAAIAKLPNLAATFLDTSKLLYASGSQYTVDYTAVLNILDTTSSVLTAQQSEAEKQLDALTTSVGFLDVIADNTETTASLLATYLTATGVTYEAKQSATAAGSLAAAGIPAYANGGLARGVSLVGENGPEIVDFVNPGRVYSNQASNDLFNTKELVAEIRNLRAEVTQLRKDQKEQTGHLIASNYDANAKAANKVVDATEEASTKTEWSMRAAVKIA